MLCCKLLIQHLSGMNKEVTNLESTVSISRIEIMSKFSTGFGVRSVLSCYCFCALCAGPHSGFCFVKRNASSNRDIVQPQPYGFRAVTPDSCRMYAHSQRSDVTTTRNNRALIPETIQPTAAKHIILRFSLCY